MSRGDKVIATGRNASTRLAHLQDSGAKILDLDLTMTEAEIAAKIKEAHQIFKRIDILVNNAGYVESGAVEEVSCVFEEIVYPILKLRYANRLDRVQRSLETNYFGPLKVTRAVLPFMREQNSGKVAFVGSIVRIFPLSMVLAACLLFVWRMGSRTQLICLCGF